MRQCFTPRLFLVLFLISANVCSLSPQGRQKLNFDKSWKFRLGHAADAQKDFMYSIANIYSKTGRADGTPIDPAFNDKDWATVQLPHDWVVGLPFSFSEDPEVTAHGYKPVGGLFPENSIGWYRKTFSLSPQDSGKRIALQFDGIFRDSKIWLNGNFIGANFSGYIGNTYDITDFVSFTGKNTLVVRADASQDEGWFYEGAGIYRHAWLLKYGPVHYATDGVYVHADIDGADATVHIDAEIENALPEECSPVLETYLTDKGGAVVSDIFADTVIAGANAKILAAVSIPLDSAHLWDLNDPYLYHAVCIVKAGDEITDSVVIPFGIRSFLFDSKEGCSLNGKKIKIQGVCCHQDHAGVGSALPDYLQAYRIRMLKEMGVNAYRTSHNPPTPELLEACDSLGMLVLDENRLLNSSVEHLSQWARQLKRDRNHPSVFMWSIGNEEGYVHTTSVGKRIAQSLLAKQKELDPSRTSTYAADIGNVYGGINEVIPVRGFNYHITAVDAYHADHPDQPLIGTEMGSTVTTRGIYKKDTVRCYVPDQDVTFPPWANLAEDWWSLAAERPFWMGGFVWTGFDYRGEPTPYQWPNINSHFGIMDMCGFPKSIYYYYQSWWLDKDVIHISPHWNWPDSLGKKLKVWVNSNADEVELFLNGNSLGKRAMQRNGHLTWDVAYTPGTVEAVGYKAGRKFSTKVETTGAPAKIVLSVDKKSLKADGADATVINVTTVDAKGREVPTADNMIWFSVEGDAKIIGVGNGDPSSHEADQYTDGKYKRHLFNGKCQLILQAGNSIDYIHVKAIANELESAVADIPQK